MTSLTDFLVARIAEDEVVARRAGWHGETDYSEWEYAAQPWGAMQVQTVGKYGNPGYEEHIGITHDSEGLSDSVDEDAGPHIARHDPARVLTECEAKRRIVEEHSAYEMGGEDYCASCGDVPQIDYPCRTLQFLALPYADHADYREEWKP